MHLPSWSFDNPTYQQVISEFLASFGFLLRYFLQTTPDLSGSELGYWSRLIGDFSEIRRLSTSLSRANQLSPLAPLGIMSHFLVQFNYIPGLSPNRFLGFPFY